MFNVRHLEPLRGFPISAFQFFSIFSPSLQYSNTPPQVSGLKPQVSGLKPQVSALKPQPPLSIPP